MRLFPVLLAITLIGACTPPSPSKLADRPDFTIEQPAESTRLLAVTSFADWCGSCKALDPKIQAVKASNSFEGVEFFTIDYTPKNTEDFYKSAAILGVDETFRAIFDGKVKTGRLYLIDRASGEIRREITQDMTVAEIAASITQTLAES